MLRALRSRAEGSIRAPTSVLAAVRARRKLGSSSSIERIDAQQQQQGPSPAPCACTAMPFRLSMANRTLGVGAEQPQRSCRRKVSAIGGRRQSDVIVLRRECWARGSEGGRRRAGSTFHLDPTLDHSDAEHTGPGRSTATSADAVSPAWHSKRRGKEIATNGTSPPRFCELICSAMRRRPSSPLPVARALCGVALCPPPLPSVARLWTSPPVSALCPPPPPCPLATFSRPPSGGRDVRRPPQTRGCLASSGESCSSFRLCFLL
ncbi:hypothetical protein SCHPADRAFT_948267 [Schizopora paradoxa]|uniref:Uncharacterized protein n=1 Tax=Schizopora paradoxa TaxID=27342 RepID=A0A0H2QWZ0_9AGAM|nr:hypothetical protein SCHPADRAFT_948267 [Schizopora paradoxa]